MNAALTHEAVVFLLCCLSVDLGEDVRDDWRSLSWDCNEAWVSPSSRMGKLYVHTYLWRRTSAVASQ